jgi:hypothetical protein
MGDQSGTGRGQMALFGAAGVGASDRWGVQSLHGEGRGRLTEPPGQAAAGAGAPGKTSRRSRHKESSRTKFVAQAARPACSDALVMPR